MQEGKAVKWKEVRQKSYKKKSLYRVCTCGQATMKVCVFRQLLSLLLIDQSAVVLSMHNITGGEYPFRCYSSLRRCWPQIENCFHHYFWIKNYSEHRKIVLASEVPFNSHTLLNQQEEYLDMCCSVWLSQVFMFSQFLLTSSTCSQSWFKVLRSTFIGPFHDFRASINNSSSWMRK